MLNRFGTWYPDKDFYFSAEVAEISHLDTVAALIPKGGVAIDCGAHVGFWTRIMAGMFDSVVAIEANRENLECLEKNTMHLENVRTIHAAVGGESKQVGYHNPRNFRNTGAGWIVDGEGIDMIRIDDLGLDSVAFIKLDIEGCEPFAIDGAVETLERCHPVVLVEQKPETARYGLPFDTAGKKLEAMGYSLKTVLNKDYIYV